MDFKDKILVITGAASGIGKQIREDFENLGGKVAYMDLQDGAYFVGNTGSKKDLETFTRKLLSDYGKVDYIVNNAPPRFLGIDQASYEDMQNALNESVVASFYLVKLLKDYLNQGASIVNISSTKHIQSQAFSVTYSASKGAIHALTTENVTLTVKIASISDNLRTLIKLKFKH